jgi:predicted ATPase/class 3 adenylate cyclase
VNEQKPNSELRKLEQAIVVLEGHRAELGDAVVDAALLSMREKTSALMETQNETQQRKLVTLLFMDIAGSTSIIKDLDPEDNMAIMDTALRRLAKPIYTHGGRVARYMGDGFKAYFGAPVARENDPEMGIRAALQILAEAQDYAREVEAQWQIKGFSVRIGINTGMVIVGGDTEAENTIMGTAVNLAARLESAATPGTVLISEHTYRHVRGVFDLQLLEPLTAKGFVEPIQVYQVLRARPHAFRLSTRRVAGIETRMVGREAELLMLQNMFRDAAEEAEVQVVTVVGDAGVGKKRLLHEFEKWVELLPEQVWYFKGRATPETEVEPYGLVRRMFAHRFEVLESDSVSAVQEKFRVGMAAALSSDEAELVGQLLGFDFSTSLAVQEHLGSDSFGELATTHLTDYLRAMASEPTVILLEDIHWADDSSLDLLDHLVTAVSDARLLVICLARPPLFERRPDWVKGEEIHTQINLKPLSRRASRALVGDILQKVGNTPAELRDLIVESAEGNPFYLEELVKMLIEDGVIIPGQEQWQIELARLAEVRVPPTLTGILQARLDCLPKAEKRVLQHASVVGKLFWAEAVAELASDEAEVAQVDQHLEALLSRELIFRRDHSLFDTAHEYSFKSNILRDITYETVLRRQRRGYHAKVAEWLESNAGERISEYLSLIARHYELAGETEKAVHFLQRLGEESLQVSAFRDAVRAFEGVLALYPAVELGEAEAESTTIPNADLAERAMLLVQLGNLYNRVGDYLVAVQHLEQGLDLARQSKDSQAEIAALNRLAQAASERGSYETAQRYLGEVLALAREQEDLVCIASTLSMLSTIAWKWGDLEQAEKCGHESLAIYRKLGDRYKISQLHNILGILATLQENYNQAEEYYEQGLRMAREADLRQIVADLLNNLGYLNHHRIGNLAKASQCYQASLLIAKEIDHRSGATSTLINLGQLHILLDEQQVAWNYLREALIESVSIGAVPLTLDAIVGVAQLQIEIGQHLPAAELLGFVLNHPALELDSRQVAKLSLDRLRKVIHDDQLEAAMGRGNMLELDGVVAELGALAAEVLEEPKSISTV